MSLAAKLESNQSLSPVFTEMEINLEAFGIGVGLKGVSPVSDKEIKGRSDSPQRIEIFFNQIGKYLPPGFDENQSI